MNRTIAFIGLLLFAPLQAVSWAGTLHANQAEQQLIQLENKLADAIVRRDLKYLAGIYSDGFIRTEPYAGQLNKQQWLARLKSDTDRIKFITVRDITVRLFEDTAILTGHMTVRGRNPETEYNQEYSHFDWFTHTFVRHQGRWQLVASHAAIITETGIHTDISHMVKLVDGVEQIVGREAR